MDINETFATGEADSFHNTKSPSATPINTTQIVQNAINELRLAKQQNIKIELYCPDRDYEILLAESAQTLAVRCLLGMVGTLKAEIISCQNSGEMTKGGYIPVVRVIPSYNMKPIIKNLNSESHEH